MNTDSCILVVGHNDIIENSLVSHLRSKQFENVISSSEIALNTTIQSSVYSFFSKNKPEYVFLASTRSGGIEANQKFGGEFIYHNLESQNNVVHSAYKFGTKKLLFYAGSCVYPKEASQPMNEELFLTGALEKTSEPYSVAKVAGVELCQAYRRQYGLKAIVAVPATIYGPGSDVDLEKAHVMGALIAKFHQAVVDGKKEVFVWGTGKPEREFLYIDDFVSASMFLMDGYDDEEIVNVGYGKDISIKDLAEMIKKISGFSGEILFDETRPDGAMKKLLDHSKMSKLGWKPKVKLEEGVKKTYQWYEQTQKTGLKS